MKQETVEVPEDILALVEKREKIRAEKDFAASDKIRDEIANKGWQINDTKDGYKLKKL
ncbi:hypothetical protein GOV10_03940 [Candidatus Woesearchaeota archaeon]|nr:hypothetical protein [Candidatus Woesearchaeota archaeon]